MLLTGAGVLAPDGTMIDVLTLNRRGRLTVQAEGGRGHSFALQGIDYWSRVAWHHKRGEFQKLGFFSGLELSPGPPLLMMVTPALHIHPATDTLLRYISPEIEWTLLGTDERWRYELKLIFRKRPGPENLASRRDFVPVIV